MKWLSILVVAVMALSACKKSSDSSSGGGLGGTATFPGTWNFTTGSQSHVSGGCGSSSSMAITGPITLNLTSTGANSFSITVTQDPNMTGSGTISANTATVTLTDGAPGVCGTGGASGPCTISGSIMSCTFVAQHCDDCVTGSDGVAETSHTVNETISFTKA